MATARVAAERSIIRVAGPEARDFLHGLVTSNAETLPDGALRYAALLTPQGKYLADFLMLGEPEAVCLDLDAGRAPGLAQRLAMYRLRRKLEIAEAGLTALQLWGEDAERIAAETAAACGGTAARDPRSEGAGWRVYAADGPAALAAAIAAGAKAGDRADWDALRVAEEIPEPGAELDDDVYILEAGFERLGGVDFRKGCFVGQEIVARMKHKIELRRGLVAVSVDGPAPAPGTEVLDADGKPAGRLGAVAGGRGLALLRFDRAGGEMRAGEARLKRV